MDIRELIKGKHAKYTKYTKYTKHTKYTPDTDVIRCPTCKKPFATQRSLKKHMALVSCVPVSKYGACPYCNEDMEQKSSASRRSHTYHCKQKNNGIPYSHQSQTVTLEHVKSIKQQIASLEDQLVARTNNPLQLERQPTVINNINNINQINNNYNVTINVFPQSNKYGVYPQLGKTLEECLSLMQDNTGSYQSNTASEMIQRVIQNHFSQEENKYVQRDTQGGYSVINDITKGFEETPSHKVKHVMGQCAYNTLDEVITVEELNPSSIPKDASYRNNPGMKEIRDSQAFDMSAELSTSIDQLVPQISEQTK